MKADRVTVTDEGRAAQRDALEGLRAKLEALGFTTGANNLASQGNLCKWYAWRQLPVGTRDCECNEKPPSLIVTPMLYTQRDRQYTSADINITGQCGEWFTLNAYSVNPDTLPEALPKIEAALVCAWQALDTSGVDSPAPTLAELREVIAALVAPRVGSDKKEQLAEARQAARAMLARLDACGVLGTPNDQGQCLRAGVAESVLDTRNGNADWTKAGTGVNSPTSPGSISRKASTGSAGSNPAAGAPHTVDWLGLALDLEAQAKRVESQTVERAMLAGAHGLRLMGAHGVGSPVEAVSSRVWTEAEMLAAIRNVGGIVHSDGNVFFTNWGRMLAAVDELAKVARGVEEPKNG